VHRRSLGLTPYALTTQLQLERQLARACDLDYFGTDFSLGRARA
jgi:hypothetical protein